MGIQYIQDYHQLQEVIPIIMGQNSWGFDTETTGTDPFNNRVTLMQIGNEQVQFVINTLQVNIEGLRRFLEDPTYTKVGHNLKFDYRMMKGTFGYEMENLKCTFLGEKILTNGLKFQGFALDDLMLNYLGIPMDKGLQKSFIGNLGPFTQAQIEYAAADVKNMLPMARILYRELRAKNLIDTWALECNAIPAFGDMELHGVLLDKKPWLEIAQEHVVESKKLILKMGDFIKPYCNVNLWDEVEFNFSSPQQIVDVLNAMGAKVREYNPSTDDYDLLPVEKSDDATMKKIVGSPIVEDLKKYRTHQVMVSTFGQSFVDAIHPKTGKIHADYAQIGTETGRIAKGHSPVNFLNIPRDKRMRNCIIAPPDYLIETDDYSGCELRIWAHISQDPNLVEALRKGEDLHCSVASRLFGKEVTKSNENKGLRVPGKTLNFGKPVGFALCA